MARVAFIGLGNMGGGMAANLAAKGEEVVAFDLAAPALERAKGNGCSIATSSRGSRGRGRGGGHHASGGQACRLGLSRHHSRQDADLALC